MLRKNTVLSPIIGFPLEVKQAVLRFRSHHSWRETCEKFPEINPETWRRWINNREVIMGTTHDAELQKREAQRKITKSRYLENHPELARQSIMRQKHPLIVCCYRSNGNFKKFARKNKTPFTRLEPRTLWRLAKKQKLKCAITGIRLTAQNVSVDHIRPVSQGGLNCESNIRLVHKDINHMKNHYDDAYFLQMCQLVSANFQADKSQLTASCN